MLGQILSQIRFAVVSGQEFHQWIQSKIVFQIVDNKKMLPLIEIEVFKEGQSIEVVKLESQPFFVFGANPQKSHVVLRHASISRCHAAIVID